MGGEIIEEQRRHEDTKVVLQKALDDLDAWEEERETLARVHRSNVETLEGERQQLIETEVALRAEIHRLQQQHNAERQHDLAQLRMLNDAVQDAAAMRAHVCELEQRVKSLQHSLEQAQGQAAEHLAALEACVSEASSGHETAQRALAELQQSVDELEQLLARRDAAHAVRLQELAVEQREALEALQLSCEQQTAREVQAANDAAGVQHKAEIAQREDARLAQACGFGVWGLGLRVGV